MYYQEQMMRSSRESGLDACSHDDEVQMPGEGGKDEDDEETAETHLDQEPVVEPEGVWERREAKGAGDYPESPAATASQRSRPKLSRMGRVESSSVSSSSDEEEGPMCPHGWVPPPPSAALAEARAANRLFLSEQWRPVSRRDTDDCRCGPAPLAPPAPLLQPGVGSGPGGTFGGTSRGARPHFSRFSLRVLPLSVPHPGANRQRAAEEQVRPR